MKIAELKAVVEARTKDKKHWPMEGVVANELGWAYTVKSLHDVKAIDVLSDHAEALIELVEACEDTGIKMMPDMEVQESHIIAIKYEVALRIRNALQKLENI